MSTVTVAIPTKNVEDTIGQTLRKLDRQTRPPDRVLIADSSTDDTATIAQGFDAGFEIEVFEPERPGVGAAREALRQRAPPGLLVCLDAEVSIRDDWLAEHMAIHEEHDWAAVVSGTWPDAEGNGTTVLSDPSDPAFFIEANCSMPTEVAERIGGWDANFSRGCDWDFRIRLSGAFEVDAIASDRVSATPMESNNGPLLHIKKQLGRPSSVPYLRKYGDNYAYFHPMHVMGDAVGVSACLAAAVALLWPPALMWPIACMVAYMLYFKPPGFSLSERVLSAPAVFALGTTTIGAMVSRGATK